MNQNEFSRRLGARLSEKLIELDIKTEDFVFRRVEKANECYDGLTVAKVGTNVGVNLNLNRLFEKYKENENFDGILNEAVNIVTTGLKNTPNVDFSLVTDYERIKDLLTTEVISVENNESLLNSVPHKKFLDMAIVYRIVLSRDTNGRSTVLVTNVLFDNYNVSVEKLHEDAVASAQRTNPATIRGISEVLLDMIKSKHNERVNVCDEYDEDEYNDDEVVEDDMDDSEEFMYVATVPDKSCGACVMSYQDFFEQAAYTIGGDFYVLPSSIHEVLLVKDNGFNDIDNLERMVREVNATEVDPEDKLTDSVYHYDSRDGVFEFARKYCSRKS